MFSFILTCIRTLFRANKFKRGDYSFIEDNYERIQCKQDFYAVESIGKSAWTALKQKNNNFIVNKISKNMYEHMSDESRNNSIHQLKYISQYGWYQYVFLILLYQENKRISYV